MIRRPTELVVGPTVVELLGDPAAWQPQPHAARDRMWINEEDFAWEQYQFDLER